MKERAHYRRLTEEGRDAAGVEMRKAYEEEYASLLAEQQRESDWLEAKTRYEDELAEFSEKFKAMQVLDEAYAKGSDYGEGVRRWLLDRV